MLPTLLVIALLPALQDPANDAPQGAPSPVVQGGRTLPLRVEDVARFALERAPGIRQAHLAALANSGTVQETDGIFDPIFFADATGSYNQFPTSGGFLNAGITSSHIRQLQANQGLRTLLVTGASVSLSVNESYVEDNLPVGFFGINPESDVGFNFSITQPILRGGWTQVNTQAVQQAEIAYDRGMADLRVAEVNNLQSSIDAFWDLAFARDDVGTKQLSLELAEELKDVTEARFRVGAAAEVEVVQTESDIATRTDQLITALNLVDQSEDSLRTLIFDLEEQQEWDLELVPVSEPPPAEPVDMRWEDAFEVARENRAEIRQLILDVEAAELDLEVAKWNMLPKLDVTAQANSRGQADQILDAFSPAFGLRAHGYSIAVVLEVALGNNTFRGAERRAHYLVQLAQRALRDFEHTLAAEVRDAVRNINFFSDRVRATKKAAEVGRRTLEAEERRLEEGASTNFQVLQFQRDLAQAITLEKAARYAYAKAVTRLRLVQGLDWDGDSPAPLQNAESLEY